MKSIMNTTMASLVIDEKTFQLIPNEMTLMAPNTFERIFDGIRVTLTCKQSATYFTSCLRLTNVSENDSSQIKLVKSLDMTFNFNNQPVFESISGDDCGAVSFVPFVNSLDKPLHMEPRGGRSSDATGFPFFDIGDGQSTCVFGIGWTGQWCLDVNRFNNRCQVSVGLADCDFYLKPHESVRFPSVIVMTGGDRENARIAFRNLLRENFAPRIFGELPKLPIAIQPFDRYFGRKDTKRTDWDTELGQLEEATRASKCDFEALWMDAAWFSIGFSRGVGDYYYAPGFPHSMRPIANRVHELGMRYVMWFEIERIYQNTEMDVNHPEWMIKIEGNENRLYNLANEDAYSYLLKLIGDLIEENAVDVYRQDFNMSPLEFWRSNEEPRRKGIVEMHYIENLYRLWDDLRARFPHLLIDNCSSGGRRLDFETMQRSVTLWRSDTGCKEDSTGDTNSLWNHMQTLSVNRYLPLTCCATWEMSAYAVRGVFTGGIACNFDILSENFNYEKARELVQECRRTQCYWSGSFVPLSEANVKNDDWAAYQLNCGDTGCVYYFRKKKAQDEEFSAPLQGINPGKQYTVMMTDENMKSRTYKMSGQALCNVGVTIPMARASVLLEYKAEN